MAEQILVPLKRHDRIEDIIPYLDKIAKPGMRVIFLIRYPVEPWLRNHCVITESPREAILAGRKIMERYSWEIQRGLAEQRLLPAREALQKIGVEAVVDLYAGRLRDVIGCYTRNKDVQLIMMQAGSNHPILRLLNSVRSFFNWFKPPNLPPIILLNPGRRV